MLKNLCFVLLVLLLLSQVFCWGDAYKMTEEELIELEKIFDQLDQTLSERDQALIRVEKMLIEAEESLKKLEIENTILIISCSVGGLLIGCIIGMGIASIR